MPSRIYDHVVMDEVVTIPDDHDAIPFTSFDEVAIELGNAAFTELYAVILILCILHAVIFNPVAKDFRSLRCRCDLNGFPTGVSDHVVVRSEERRVGKECRSWGAPYQSRQKQR